MPEVMAARSGRDYTLSSQPSRRARPRPRQSRLGALAQGALRRPGRLIASAAFRGRARFYIVLNAARLPDGAPSRAALRRFRPSAPPVRPRLRPAPAAQRAAEAVSPPPAPVVETARAPLPPARAPLAPIERAAPPRAAPRADARPGCRSDRGALIREDTAATTASLGRPSEPDLRVARVQEALIRLGARADDHRRPVRAPGRTSSGDRRVQSAQNGSRGGRSGPRPATPCAPWRLRSGRLRGLSAPRGTRGRSGPSRWRLTSGRIRLGPRPDPSGPAWENVPAVLRRRGRRAEGGGAIFRFKRRPGSTARADLYGPAPQSLVDEEAAGERPVFAPVGRRGREPDRDRGADAQGSCRFDPDLLAPSGSTTGQGGPFRAARARRPTDGTTHEISRRGFPEGNRRPWTPFSRARGSLAHAHFSTGSAAARQSGASRAI